MCVCAHVRVRMYVCVRACACAAARACAWLRACVRACVRLCMRLCVRLCVCVYLTYRELPQVATLVRVPVGGVSAGPEAVVQPGEQVPHRLGAGDDVEGRGQRAPLVKVAHPQLGAGKLPLNVRMVLHPQGEHVRT